MKKRTRMIVLVGGRPFSTGRWYNCKPGDETFTIDWPEMEPHELSFSSHTFGAPVDLKYTRYLYKVRDNGGPFAVGIFEARGGIA